MYVLCILYVCVCDGYLKLQKLSLAVGQVRCCPLRALQQSRLARIQLLYVCMYVCMYLHMHVYMYE